MLELIATNPLLRLATLGLLFAIVAVGTTLALTAEARRRQLRQGLRAIAFNGDQRSIGASLTERKEGRLAQLVARLEKAGINLTDTQSSELKEKLRSAGYDSPSAAKIYSLVRLISVIIVPSIVVYALFRNGSSVLEIYLYGSVSALVGLYGPTMVINRRIEARRNEILHSFPSCLDLMLVCVEAGLGMEAALDRVGREMLNAHPIVSQLLITATLQLRAGATREAALRRMADDAGVKEIASFATLLIQSDRLGTSIASALRIYAAEMREHRKLRAEEKAHRLPVLLSIPLVACLLPVMIGVLMLPGIVRLVREIFPVMMGTGG